MFDQTVFNISIAVSGFLGGWWLKVLWDAVRELQLADKNLTDKLATIEILVAGTYAKREELDKMANAIFMKLDRIEGKLDKKVDK